MGMIQLDDEIPYGAPDLVTLDDEIPYGPLGKTGQDLMSLLAFVAAGMLMVSIGATLLRKKEEQPEETAQA